MASTSKPITKKGVATKKRLQVEYAGSEEANRRQVSLKETLSSHGPTEEEVFLIPTHSNNSLITKALSCVETRTITSDFTIHVEDSTYLTHKIVLYVHSGYFASIIKRYKGNQCTRLPFKDRAFRPIFEYMYSGEVRVSRDNVNDVLELSYTLEMPDLANALHDVSAELRQRTEKSTTVGKGLPPSLQDKRGQETILLFGGRDPIHPKNDDHLEGKRMYQFVPGKDNWHWQVKGTSPVPFDDAGVVVLNGTVYICGGWRSRVGGKLRASDEMWSFNPSEGQWQPLASMANSRVHHATVAANERIYVIGGTDGHQKIFSSVECYDPLTNQWRTVAPFPFSCLGVAATQYQAQIWVCGGLKQAEKPTCGTPTDLVHVYSPHEDVWKIAPRLRIPRAFANLIVVSNQMYLVGGIGTTDLEEKVARSISDIDVYLTENRSWNHWTDMFDQRHCFGTVAIGSDLYAVGGMSSSIGGVLTSVELFDTVQRKCLIGVRLPVGLTGMGCVSVPTNTTQ